MITKETLDSIKEHLSGDIHNSHEIRALAWSLLEEVERLKADNEVIHDALGNYQDDLRSWIVRADELELEKENAELKKQVEELKQQLAKEDV